MLPNLVSVKYTRDQLVSEDDDDALCYVGSPLVYEVIDPKCLTVNWDSMQLRRIGDVVQVEVITDGSAIDAQISCSVEGKRSTPWAIKKGATFIFTITLANVDRFQ